MKRLSHPIRDTRHLTIGMLEFIPSGKTSGLLLIKMAEQVTSAV